MKKNIRKSICIIIIILAFLGLVFVNRIRIKNLFFELRKEPTPEAISLEEIEELKTEEEDTEAPKDIEVPKVEKAKPKEIIIPDQINIDVPFTSQAPYANWSEPWQNACEEAAILMVHHFWQGKRSFTKDEANQEILDMIDFQIKNYGSHKDLFVKEVSQLAKDYYGYKKVDVVYDITIDDIKRELAQGNPVVVPAYGRILDNPNYTQPGPIYHMLVVVGYTPKIIITNDPGTRKGDEFQYSYDNFYNAIHDWVEGAKENPGLMKKGRKAMIVINK